MQAVRLHGSHGANIIYRCAVDHKDQECTCPPISTVKIIDHEMGIDDMSGA